ncbi:MAG: SET domain-containing protein-lysine N-methyltransferase, partial [Gammaproteobacteria bacterium]
MKDQPGNHDHALYVVRRSGVHGYGAFAARDIRKGEVLDEYVGDRITHEQADERYKGRDVNDSHTFLLTLDERIVIDGSIGGNDTRFINHQCEPNCEPRIRKGRVFIVATRLIRAGEELGFEYNIGRDADDPENVDEIYACLCGSPRCRGTILWPPKRPTPRRPGRDGSPGGNPAKPR